MHLSEMTVYAFVGQQQGLPGVHTTIVLASGNVQQQSILFLSTLIRLGMGTSVGIQNELSRFR